jgi:transcriptional regulator with XRE-family HTH domain
LQSSKIIAVPKKKKRPEATSRNKGAAALREYMKAHELTQFQLAEQLDCTRPHVAMLLAGSPPSLGVAVRIEKILGIACRDWTEPVVPPTSERRPRAA